MDIKKLKETVNLIEQLKSIGASETIQINTLVEFLYNTTNGELMPLFLTIDELKKKEILEEKQKLTIGLEAAMHLCSNFSISLNINNKNWQFKKIKELDKTYFNNAEGNIAYIIPIAMAYFPKGNSKGASLLGDYFFARFLDLLMANKEKYLNGDSKGWAESHGYSDYIKLVIEENSK